VSPYSEFLSKYPDIQAQLSTIENTAVQAITQAQYRAISDALIAVLTHYPHFLYHHHGVPLADGTQFAVDKANGLARALQRVFVVNLH
jgi:hypothetical protein